MITPKQNASVAEQLSATYFVCCHHDNPHLNCMTVAEKTLALIRGDRLLSKWEECNKEYESKQRRLSLFNKIVKQFKYNY